MKTPKPFVIIIFGATGDLTRRKLIPALFALKQQHLLPETFAILGTGRKNLDDASFREQLQESLLKHSDLSVTDNVAIGKFLNHIHYQALNQSNSEAYQLLTARLEELSLLFDHTLNFLFYLATPPQLFSSLTQKLHQQKLLKAKGAFRRIVYEKPFGTDLLTAQSLNRELHQYLTEDQIFRIDHYLGKETVQNLLVTRFANGIFEPLWNRNYIDHIEISSAESIGIEGRGGYYDQAGALRDMVQNHLLQLVGLTAMEPPSSMDPNAIRNEVHKVFQSFRSIKAEQVAKQVIRGQYTESTVNRSSIQSYRDEAGVNTNSRTETFVAMQFYIDNWRWGGGPFYIRSGKALPTRVTEIVIYFKTTPHKLFIDNQVCQQGNQLIIRIQPDEGVLLKYGMKIPGAGFEVQQVNMDFHYRDLQNTRIPEAYERLLLDALNGDATLFARADAVETAWKFIDPIHEAWNNHPDIPLYGYPAGTWGPEQSDQLKTGDQQTWRYPCKNLSQDGTYCEL